MAQILLEPFIGYALSDITQIWNQVITGSHMDDAFGTTGAPHSGQYLALKTDANISGGRKSGRYLITPQFPLPSGARFIVGMRVNVPDLTTVSTGGTTEGVNTTLWSVRYGGTTQVWCTLNSDGTFSVLRGSTVLATSTGAVSSNVWNTLEWSVLIDGSTGTVNMRINGVSALSATGLDTKGSSAALWNEFALGSVAAAGASVAEMRVIDLYLADGSGSAWNDFMGDVRLDVRAVTAEGTHTDSTPSTGSDRSATVDDTSMNGDTDYNTFDTAGQVDTYVVQDAAVAGADILGLEIRAQMEKEDAGAAGVKLCALINGTLYEGTEQGIPSSYGVIRESLGSGINPDTSAAWTDTGASGFNASEFGAKKST